MIHVSSFVATVGLLAILAGIMFGFVLGFASRRVQGPNLAGAVGWIRLAAAVAMVRICPARGRPLTALQLDHRLAEYLFSEAKQSGILLTGLIRALLEAYVRRKTGCDTPYFSMHEKTLERVF